MRDAVLKASAVSDPLDQARFFDDVLDATAPRFDAYPGPLDPPAEGAAGAPGDPLGGIKERIRDEVRRLKRTVDVLGALPDGDAFKVRIAGYLAGARAKALALGIDPGPTDEEG